MQYADGKHRKQKEEDEEKKSKWQKARAPTPCSQFNDGRRSYLTGVVVGTGSRVEVANRPVGIAVVDVDCMRLAGRLFGSSHD